MQNSSTWSLPLREKNIRVLLFNIWLMRINLEATEINLCEMLFRFCIMDELFLGCIITFMLWCCCSCMQGKFRRSCRGAVDTFQLVVSIPWRLIRDMELWRVRFWLRGVCVAAIPLVISPVTLDFELPYLVYMVLVFEFMLQFWGLEYVTIKFN